jgi:transglutaminase-like putative cysteine protease
MYIDEAGETWMTTTEMFGQSLVTQKVDAAEALTDVVAGELDIAVSTLVKVKRIPQGHDSRQATYKVTTRGEDPTKQFVSGEGQTVKLISPEVAEIVVTAIPVPTTAKSVGSPPDPLYLRTSGYLQSNDATVIDHANRAAAGATDNAKIARQMELYVHDNLKKKNFSTALASAAEVAKSLQGDCTEHAVLLAAMLRAKNIPSRIAVGLVYVDKLQAFGGHMWTEAWLDGQWVPLDATLGKGGTGAAHLKMGDSSFADDAAAPVVVFLPMLRVLGHMTIDVVDSK